MSEEFEVPELTDNPSAEERAEYVIRRLGHELEKEEKKLEKEVKEAAKTAKMAAG